MKERFLRMIKVGENVTASILIAKHKDIEEIYRRFGSLYNVCQKQGFPDLYVTEIPVSRENARIEGVHQGSRVAAYRFLMTVRV